MIWNIALKDLQRCWIPLLITVIIGLVIMTLVLLTTGAARSGPYSGHYSIQWTWPNVSAVYAVAAIIPTLTIGLAFATFYGGEIKSGTVRALVLYPIDLNDLAFAKLLSSSILGSTEAAIMYFFSIGPFMVYGIIPAGGAVLIFFLGLLTTLFIVFAGAFLSHVLTFITGRMFLTPSLAVGLMLLFAILGTQVGLNLIGMFLLYLKSVFGGGLITAQDLSDLWETAGALSILSPHHATATILTGVLGPSSHFPDVYVVIPVGVALILGGLYLGRKIYLDVFIR